MAKRNEVVYAAMMSVAVCVVIGVVLWAVVAGALWWAISTL